MALIAVRSSPREQPHGNVHIAAGATLTAGHVGHAAGSSSLHAALHAGQPVGLAALGVRGCQRSAACLGLLRAAYALCYYAFGTLWHVARPPCGCHLPSPPCHPCQPCRLTFPYVCDSVSSLRALTQTYL